MQVNFKSKSRSTGKGGTTQSLNDQNQKRHLLEAAEFAKLGTGRAVIINPAYTRGNEAYVPLLQSVKVPQADITQMNWSEMKWDLIRQRLIASKDSGVTDEERSRQFQERRDLAEQLFPVPTETPLEQDLAAVF